MAINVRGARRAQPAFETSLKELQVFAPKKTWVGLLSEGKAGARGILGTGK